MTVGKFNWNALVCRDERLLMHLSDTLRVAMEEGVVVDEVWVVMKLSWQALTVEKCELVILELNLGRISVH